MSETNQETSDAHTQSSQERISAVELRARSHDLELLISLASTYALATLPSVLVALAGSVATTLPAWLLSLLRVACIYVGAMCYTLAIVFACHLLLRAIWIAVIGMDTYFPLLKSWRENKFIGPIAFEQTNQSVGARDQLAVKLDRWATTVFVLGITVVALTIISLLFGIVGAAIALSVERAFGATGNQVIIVLLWFFLAIIVLIVVAQRLDRRYGIKQQTPSKTMGRLIRIAVQSQNIGPMKAINQLLQPLFADRVGTYGYILVAVLFGIAGSQVSFQLTPELSKFSAGVEASLLNGRVEKHYGALDSADPMVESFVIREPLLQLRLPFSRARDADAMAKLCGAKYQDDLVGCAKRYWKIEMDGAPIVNADWLLVGNRSTRRLALEVLVPFDQVSRGLHRLKIERWKDPEDKKPASVIGVPVYYLPN